ncbi:MAG: YpdA family putative bacillithiol disulfide reductase [Gemmatimonadota bacterium]|nr:YpdA family putative bacillithiol disulfide reductase [Gemmatimonadota bacterium]
MSEKNLDLVVVGAGPCGIAAGAAARAAGLRTVLFDRGCVTQSLIGYPYYMTFFSTAEKLEIAGVPFTIPDSKPTRRDALAYFRRVVRQRELDVRQYEEVTSVTGVEGDITVHTRCLSGVERAVRTRAVAIATGGFSEPNWLRVPGEDLPKVLHYYREPYPFYDQDVLVVGGRNSAVESALELHRNGARVTMVHFEDTLDPGVKAWVIPDIANRLENGEIQMYYRHRVAEVKPDSVVLRAEHTRRTVELPNQWVLAMTGWRADQQLLRSLGVEIDDTTGIPTYDPSTMQTNVPGVFVAGVLAAGNDANKIFIENGRDHGALIARALVDSRAHSSSR